MRSFTTLFLALASLFLAVQADYWMGGISHQGVAPFAESGYTVFRNVKDYGAIGESTCLRLAVFQGWIEGRLTDLQVTELRMTLRLLTQRSRLGIVVGKDVYVNAEWRTSHQPCYAVAVVMIYCDSAVG